MRNQLCCSCIPPNEVVWVAREKESGRADNKREWPVWCVWLSVDCCWWQQPYGARQAKENWLASDLTNTGREKETNESSVRIVFVANIALIGGACESSSKKRHKTLVSLSVSVSGHCFSPLAHTSRKQPQKGRAAG